MADKRLQEEYQQRTGVEHEILQCLVGSQAYGTALPTSDHDYRGVYVPPQRLIMGVGHDKGVKRFGKDDQSYSIGHFARLAMKNTPNMLELLFCEEDCVVLSTLEGQKLREQRDIFLCKQFMDRYVGYAKGQLAESAVKPQNRGQGRIDLIEKFGYDTKFAMHTIRILESARDFWLTGKLEVRRPNGEFLISIREGRFKTYEEFKAYAEALIEEVRSVETMTDSPLPDEPDTAAIDRLTRDIYESYWTSHPELKC